MKCDFNLKDKSKKNEIDESADVNNSDIFNKEERSTGGFSGFMVLSVAK